MKKILLLLFLLFSLVLSAKKGCFNTRIPPPFNKAQTHEYRVGVHTVTIEVNRVPGKGSGDDGPVTLMVSVDGQPGTSLDSYFDYDTLMDVPPARISYWWMDFDLFPDLIIEIPPATKYFVGSKDGQLHFHSIK
ncbi:MAG: hypothetical protein Q8O72_00120 [Bacteroidales bacterium]|nr:hypothetical protein [Bacteroidales bacterium]